MKEFKDLNENEQQQVVGGAGQFERRQKPTRFEEIMKLIEDGKEEQVKQLYPEYKNLLKPDELLKIYEAFYLKFNYKLEELYLI